MIQETKIPDTQLPVPSLLSRALDSVAYAISPKWGARRKMQRHSVQYMDSVLKNQALSRGGLHSSKNQNRTASWLTSRLSPDAEATKQLIDVQDQSVSLYKTDPTAHGIIETRVNNEVGMGIMPQGRVKKESRITKSQAEQINSTTEDVIQEWSAAGVDRTGVQNLTACQREVNRTFSQYGEFFVELSSVGGSTSPIPMILDHISPRQIETPPKYLNDPLVKLGIRYDKKGRVVGYYKREQEAEELNVTSKTKYRLLRRFDKLGNVKTCHVKDPLFANQSRGLPWLIAALPRFKDISDMIEATIVATQIEACFTTFIKSASNPLDISKANSSATGSNSERIEDVYPGMVSYIGLEDEVTFGNPSRPGPSFAPFMEFCLRNLASATSTSYETLAKDWKGVTYSSGRLSLLDGRLGFVARRQLMVDQWLKFVWYRAVLEMIFAGLLPEINLQDYIDRPWIYRRHRWAGQGWKDMDPGREVKARVDGVGNDVESLTEGLEERGIDLDDHLARRLTEKTKLAEQNVAVRKIQWDLETAAGLPHEEEEVELGRPEEDTKQPTESREPVTVGD